MTVPPEYISGGTFYLLMRIMVVQGAVTCAIDPNFGVFYYVHLAAVYYCHVCLKAFCFDC